MGSDEENSHVREDDQAAPLLGPPKLPEFDSFMESSVLTSATDGEPDHKEASKSGKTTQHTAYQIPEAFRQAPRFMNIPELSSASAEWNSTNMKTIFILLMVVCIFEIVLSLPLALALLGILTIAAAILGIIAASLHLCESCQGPVMDSNVSVIKILTGVALALDCLFMALFWLWLIPDIIEHSHGAKVTSIVVVWLCLTSPTMIHVALSVVILRRVAAVQRALHPVQPGTVLVS